MFPLQERVFLIPLTDVQSIRTVSPYKRGKLPSLEINYISQDRPTKISISLKQVMTIVTKCSYYATLMENSILFNLGRNFALLTKWMSDNKAETRENIIDQFHCKIVI